MANLSLNQVERPRQSFDPVKTAGELRLWAIAGKDKFFQEVPGNERSEWVEVGVETLRLILRNQWIRQKVGDGDTIRRPMK